MILCGIYCIQNKINGKSIIGQSVDVKKRWSNYNYELNKNIYHNRYLQESWNKYSKDNFEFSIIEECEESKLNEREIYWIEFYNTYKDKSKGYNLTPGGESLRGSDNPSYIEIENYVQEKIIKLYQDGNGLNNIGKIFNLNQHTIKRILKENNIKIRNHSESRKGKNMGDKHPMFGKYHSEETKRKISENNATPSGKNHPQYIKIEKDIQEKIIELYLKGEGFEKVGENFNIGRSVVKRILKENNIKLRNNSESKKGKKWEDLWKDKEKIIKTKEKYSKVFSGKNSPRYISVEEDIKKQIIALNIEGKTYKYIGELFNLSYYIIRKVLKGII